MTNGQNHQFNSLMNNNRPNLFVIGAMKCGSTSLHNYLNMHPEIFMCEPKEPGYFVKEINWDKGENWYLSLFKNASSSHQYIGESSTYYTKLPTFKGVAERIYQFNPEAKLVYVMRNPFERIVSHYWHVVRRTETGGLRKNIVAAYESDPEYAAISDYAYQLEEYLGLFPKENIYCLTFEELTTNLQTEMEKLLFWLGLEVTIDYTNITKQWNKKPEILVGVSRFGLLNKFRHSNTWEKAATLTPKFLRKIATCIATEKINQKDQQQHISALKEKLHPVLSENIKRLESLTGKKYKELWLPL